MSEPNEIDCRCTCKECEARTQDTYKLSASCGNCGWKGVAILRKGDKPSWLRECPHCGRSGLTYGSDPVFDEAPAPAQSREDEALRLALMDECEGSNCHRLQAIADALCSRQSPPPADEALLADVQFLLDASDDLLSTIDSGSKRRLVERLQGALAAAPQPSPQGKDAERDIVGRLLAACNGHPYAKIAWPHRLLHDAVAEIKHLRSRLASAPSSAQGEEAREMREAIDAIADNSTPDEMGENADEFSRADWMDAYKLCVERAREARAALERKETK